MPVVYVIPGYPLTGASITAKDGQISFCASGAAFSILTLDFVTDQMWFRDNSSGYLANANISQRNTIAGYTIVPWIKHTIFYTGNNIASCTYPQTPRNKARLGLPNPTVAIAGRGAGSTVH